MNKFARPLGVIVLFSLLSSTPADTPNPICLRAILRFTNQRFRKSSIARILEKYNRFSACEFKTAFNG